MEIKKVAVLGTGNGAQAVAADLTKRGYAVTLFELPQFKGNIEPLIKKGGIEIIRNGTAVFYQLAKITTDIKDALADADCIMPVVPAFAHEPLAGVCAPHVKDGQAVILNPGSTFGLFQFRQTFQEKGVRAQLHWAETASLPYAARLVEPGTVKILLDTKVIYFAAFPATKTEEIYREFKKMFPVAVKLNNILDVAMNNGNPVSHPCAAILNTGRIEFTKGNYFHYKEGITPSVAKVKEDLDKERMAICRAYGAKEITTLERMVLLGYARPGKNLYEEYTTSEVFAPIKAPENIHGRFITEDIACGLVPWSNLADLAGIATPLIDSFIHIASSIHGINYFREGRTLAKIGLGGMTPAQIINYVNLTSGK